MSVPKVVLVADDDPQVLDLLSLVLKRAGYKVVEAADGKQALAKMHDQPVDVVITDIIMPEQEGMETISRIRRDFPSIKIIAISGALGGRYLRVAELLGANAVLNKPLDPEHLLQTVQSVLS